MKKLIVVGCLLGLSAQAGTVTMLDEDFSSCTNTMGATGTGVTTNGAASNVQIQNNLATYGLTGWSGNYVFCAFATNAVTGSTNYMVKLGSSALGWIQTPPMNLSGGGGKFTVMFRAGAWWNDSTTIDVEHLSASGALIDRYPITTLSTSEMRPFAINMTNGTLNSSIRFTARNQGNNRFFLDDVCVTGEQPTMDMNIANPTATVVAGQVVSAVVTTTDTGTNITAIVEATNIPLGNPYAFDGTSFSWTPQTTGNFWIRFAASNDTEKVSHTMTIKVNLPAPQTPVVTTTPGSICLSWNPVPGATGYSVQAYKLATEIEVFAENFSSCTNLSGATASQNMTLIAGASTTAITNSFPTYGLTGWTGYSVYCAFGSNVVHGVTNYMVKFGTGGTAPAFGWIQTPPIDLSGNGGTCTLTFRAGKWASDRGSINVLHITDNGVATNQITGMSGTTMMPYTMTLTNGTANSSICFTSLTAGSGANRFFLDDVKLSYITAAKIEVPSTQITIDGTTARVFGLPPLSEYLCTVTAADGVSETVSPEITVRTTASTLIILR